ncbi:MAG TPA: lysozyme [Rhizomicrobium sp.]|nr:lysozyme [Rhizomicrobium sp.]
MTRTVNAVGLALVKAHEGLRLEAYQDTSGIWTIGYGHTLGVKAGDSISAARAEQLLEADLTEAERAVAALVKVPLTDNQFSALVSFVFNLGEGAFARSTLLRKLNEGGHGLVPACLKSWIFDNGKVLQGLVKRRAAEAALWNMT